MTLNRGILRKINFRLVHGLIVVMTYCGHINPSS